MGRIKVETIKWKLKGGRRERESRRKGGREKKRKGERERGKEGDREEERQTEKKFIGEGANPLSRNICDSRNGSTV